MKRIAIILTFIYLQLPMLGSAYAAVTYDSMAVSYSFSDTSANEMHVHDEYEMTNKVDGTSSNHSKMEMDECCQSAICVGAAAFLFLASSTYIQKINNIFTMSDYQTPITFINGKIYRPPSIS